MIMFQRFCSGVFILTAIAAAQPSLKDAYQPYFRIGAAVNRGHFFETDESGVAVIRTHFNTITSENDLKWERIHPAPDTFNFENADRFVEFGEKNKMFIVGHCLVWHSQTPKWVFADAAGNALTREALLKRMREHIFTIVGRYRGRIHAWDVVNEALNEDGSMRQSPWFNIIGDDYVAKAFEYVKEADPQAALYYNDYSLENEAKRNGAVALVKKLQAQGIKVAAIGTQHHDRMEWPTVQQMDATFTAFKELGVKIAVTELDVDVLPRATRNPTADVSARVEASANLNPYTAGLPDDMQAALAKRYAEIFGVFLKHHDAIDRVTFWGVSDRGSWLNNFPVRGRTNHPLLFDRQEKPKPAFDAVLRFAAFYRTAQGTQEDHRRMMDLLGIQSLRRGADGRDPHAPNAANYDEAKANPYPDLPDPLKLKNGRKVTSASVWWTRRRPEIVEDFDREVYGRMPKQTPKVTWEVTETVREQVGNRPVIRKTLVGHVDNSSYPQVTVDIQLTLTTPAEAPRPVPVIMELSFGRMPPRPAGAPAGPAFPAPAWHQEALARGWGYAVLVPTSIQPDNGAGLAQGIIGLCNKGQPRKADDWGALRAWAWGASRALDYMAADKAVDAKRVGITGHSRYGKAAAVAMAYDPRFAIGYISSSGAGGLKLHRRNWGELVENVAAPSEYHWMAGNYMKYAGPLNWNDLPVDAHQLVALIAPRPVFIGAGATQGDGWVDAKGSFLAGVGAGPVYRLLGRRGLDAAEFPPIETTLIDGDIAFRQHSGGHTPAPNWPMFLHFAARYLGR